MSKEQEINLMPDHYTYMIDLLSRAGRLEQAKDFIDQMPCAPDAIRWATLLSSCRFHKNFEIGKWAADHLVKLEPNNPASYVLLTSICVAEGKWEHVAQLRRGMRDLRVKKKPGFSESSKKYREDLGTSTAKNMLANPSDEFQHLVRTSIRCINDPVKFYEKVLSNAMKMIGTDEDALTRVIVTRAEKDLKEIKDVYYKRNSVNLEHVVAKETSGDYKAFLITVLGASGNA